MHWLKVGAHRFPIREGETTLGRSRYCSVLINDASVSREHAAVQLNHGELSMTDLNSRNGTTLNGHRLSETCPIKPGDEIYIGKTQLTIIETHSIPEDISNTAEQQLPNGRTEAQTIAVPRSMIDSDGEPE